MTRDEYLYALYNCLYSLSQEERDAAMQYYTEYFADAGPENEQQVIEELGPPQEVAKQILKDFSADRYPASGYRPGGAGRARPEITWWMILTGIIALPILLPVAVGLLAALFGLLVALAAVILAVGVVTAALILGGIAGAFAALFGFSGWEIFGNGLSSIGPALISLGLGLLLLPACGWVFRRGLPALLTRFRQLWRRVRR